MNRHVLYNCESTKGLSVKAFAAGASVVILCERGMMVDYVSRHLAQRFVRLREQPLIRLITFLESNDMLNLAGRQTGHNWSLLPGNHPASCA